MTNLPAPLPSSEYQIHRRAANRYYQKPPKWLDDPKKRARVYGVYKDYLRCMTIPEILDKWKVSPGTVYRDIERARNEALRRMTNSLAGLLAERVEVHQEVIREIDEALATLRVPAKRGWPKMSAEKRARAEKELLGLKTEAHKHIDFLLGFKGKTERPPWMRYPDESGDPAQPMHAKVAVIMGGAGLRATVMIEEESQADVMEAEYRAIDDDEFDDDDEE